MELIPLKKACKQLGISYKTLYSWVKENKIEYTQIGNRYYLSQEQIQILIKISPTNEDTK